MKGCVRRARFLGFVAAVALLYLLGSAALGVVQCEATLRPPRRPPSGQAVERALGMAFECGGSMETVHITAADGAVLRGWYFVPSGPRGDAVVILHGQGDSRSGTLAFAKIALRHHYEVLLPDSRAHGESGGNLATYGLLESEDVCAWARWLRGERGARRVFGLGESLGAGILLQAVGRGDDFEAVVAESPFASLREIGYDRIGQRIGMGAGVARTGLRLVIDCALLYGRWRYGLDFERAAPMTAVATARVPILLVHGMNDDNIPRRHIDLIRGNSQAPVSVWDVPGAGHTMASTAQPAEFERRVLSWFR